jgi:hypothetical protein
MPVRHRFLLALLLGLVEGACSERRWDGRARHVEIVHPREVVALKKYALDAVPEWYALTFEVGGRCDDCSDDERVDLTVLPRTARSSWVGRAVKEVVRDRWAADVFVGDNQDSRLQDGDQLDIEAIVRHERDLVIFEDHKPRPSPPIRGRATGTVVVRGVP